jgi:hypothetical protein
MIVCPVCEHQQAAGTECENCGKQFSKANAAAVPVARLPELELTPLVGDRLNVTAAPMPDLEVTRLNAGPDLPAQRVADLELTAAPEIGEVPVQALPELDLGRSEDDGIRTPVQEGAVTCRYCRNVQAEGLVCEKCGMRLPRNATAAATPAAAGAVSKGDDEWTRCKDCGSRAKRHHRCGNCGNMVGEATV